MYEKQKLESYKNIIKNKFGENYKIPTTKGTMNFIMYITEIINCITFLYNIKEEIHLGYVCVSNDSLDIEIKILNHFRKTLIDFYDNSSFDKDIECILSKAIGRATDVILPYVSKEEYSRRFKDE